MSQGEDTDIIECPEYWETLQKRSEERHITARFIIGFLVVGSLMFAGGSCLKAENSEHRSAELAKPPCACMKR